MKLIRYAGIAVFCMTLLACSVVPGQIRDEAVSPESFSDLVANVEKYIGSTVILGGYILDVQNRSDETLITMLQTPLGIADEPKAKDHSQGRFILIHPGFLDPEIYRKDRKITAAGIVRGVSSEKVDQSAYRYLKIESRQIHLWSSETDYYRYPYDYYYWPYPYRYYRHPYHRYWLHPCYPYCW